MIRQYSYEKDKDIYLSKHFKVKEFCCNLNGVLTNDLILIDEELVYKLERLITCLNASKAIITSAYRDKQTDIAVGGSGSGTHVNGRAVDIIFYKGNEPIDTKYVSCVAQDLGFKGIARISKQSIHLDNRTGKNYYGDETKSLNTVTSDFYIYYDLKRPENKVKDYFDLSDDTMNYIKSYKYGVDLIYKMYNKTA